MAEVDFNNPNLDGDFKALLQVRQEKKRLKPESEVIITDTPPENDDEYDAKKETKVDKVRDALFEAVKTDNVQRLEKIVHELSDYNLTLLDSFLKDPETQATTLHVTLEHRSRQVARYLLNKVIDDDYLCASYDFMVGNVFTKKTALHILADNGDVSLMEELMRRIDDPEKKRSLLYKTTLLAVAGQRPRDFTPIHIAALKGNTDILDYLVKEGVDVNLTNKKEDTPALWAARGNNLDTMRRLIELHADVDHQNDKGSTPLYWAVRYGFAEMVKLLAKEGNANVNHKRKLGLVSPIVMASALGYAEIVSLLLSLGANVNTKITNDQTALHYAASSGLDDVVDVLLGYNVEVDRSNYMGMTPLHMAAKNGHLSTMRILCAHNASIECRDKFGKTVWSYAMEAEGLGVLDVVVSVYRKRGKVVGRTLILPVGEAPLHEAARIGDLEKIRYLISQGCDPLAVDAGGNTFFHVAARENQPKILKSFQNIDAMDKSNNNGDIPIHVAARSGHTGVIKVLIKKSKLNLTNELGYTALHDACSARQVPAKVVALLIKGIVDDNNWSLIDATDNKGNTALHLAALCNHHDVIPELKLLNPSILNADGDNPFHAAAKRGNSAVLEVMFDIFNTPGKGLDLEQENHEGETVLHICSKAGSIQLVNELIEAGADLAKRNKQGNTILHEMAEEMSINPTCTETLLLVYNEVVKCSPTWWCMKHDLAHPDQNSDAYIDYKRKALVFLTSEVYNFEEFNVLGYCIKNGALPLFSAIMATEDVTIMSKGKLYVYDVTNITPSTRVGQSKKKNRVVLSRAAIDPMFDDTTEDEAIHATQSYLDIIVDMTDEVLATKFLDVSPIKQLSDNLWSGYQWIYIVLMIVHIVYMSSLSATAINAAGVPFNTTTSVKYTDPPTHFPYIMFISWPIIISIYQIASFFGQMRQYTRRLRSAKSAIQDNDLSKPRNNRCFGATKFAVTLLKCIFPNLSGFTTLTFSAFIFAWYGHYIWGHRNQVYFLAVAMVLGWMLTINFTKGFRNVHAFSTMLYYIIIQDVTRFLTIYLFILIGFSLAMHTLFQISTAVANTYASPVHTIFLTFNLMLGMADLFDEQFDNDFELAGSSSLWVKLVYLFYMILATVIMLNLLIAMLSDTYNAIKRKEGSTWRVNSLRMALGIEKWLPVLKKIATRMSLLDMMTELDSEAERWFMRIPAEKTAEVADQTVTQISQEIRRLEVEISGMQGSYRGIQEKLDTILNSLEPNRPKTRVKTATKRS
ncbi:hypothetical protein LSH36_179g04076 [Paralvinella palmiformis]|uniref:Ion transport domain-containing protein n=1 Tax=Paralvinella palmiformis TaxID=53620 RepID=A0AAD9JS89_9ANNE|nr:hypothetical protein LSH36_179g04076 [Paralvinella palmiformis]